MLYVDSSALVKLVVPEPESPAVAARTSGHVLVSSGVAWTEVPRAVARRPTGSSRDPGDVLSRVTLLAVDEGVLRAAASVAPPGLGVLGAIHLASAALLAGELEAFITYDRQLAKAASAAGFQVEIPS